MMADKNIPYELSDYVLNKYFFETGNRQGWLNNNHIALAVSGGGDSTALLWIFAKFYDGKITAIHVNHGIRGKEADDDEKFTCDFSKSLGVSFKSVSVNVPDEKMKGESIESAARRIRLGVLIKSAREMGINTIMLGHNRDDLAETVLFNILRGTGIRGSVGMTESTFTDGITFYRPLLGMRREFLRCILRARNIKWREDSTNNDDKYTRNFIRLKLMPLIEENINASSTEHLARFGEDMRKVRENEDRISRELLSSCLENEDDYILNRKILRSFSDDDISLIIREIGRRLGLRTLARKRCSELSGLIKKPENFVFQWSGKMTVSGRNGKIYFSDEGSMKNNG